MPAGRRRVALWCAGTTVLWLFFLGFAADNLDNFRPISNDEAWIMSASHKLATEGVLGSDLFTGLFQGEQHYYFNLPAHHYLQAAAFRVWGTGIAQARAPSLVAATVLIWVTGWLAFRWHGLAAAWLTTALLIGWRADVGGLHPGLPLLGIARSARYDLAAVAWTWAAIGLLDRLLRRPRRLPALAAGLSAGAAALTQFFGLFAAPAIGVALAASRLAWPIRMRLLGWIALGFAALVLPYAVDAARHPAEWVGQNFTIRSPERVRIDSLDFYLDNVRREPHRFAHLAGEPRSLLLTVGIWPALAWLVVRARAPAATGPRLLLTTVVVLAAGLALVDATKAALYAVVLWPSLCLVMAGAAVAGVRWGAQRGRPAAVRLGTFAAAAALMLVVVSDSVRAYRVDASESAEASRYLDVGARLAAHLPPGSVLLGPPRWWWAMRDHRYRALNGIWWQWQIGNRSDALGPSLPDVIRPTGARFLILSDDLRTDLRRFPEPLPQQFNTFLAADCVLVDRWHDSTYGWIELYEIAGA